MSVSNMLKDISDRIGADALRGANVLVAIERPLDDAIRYSLALGPYHPGRPSPWSHCFLWAIPTICPGCCASSCD
jgi:hypothetical protein